MRNLIKSDGRILKFFFISLILLSSVVLIVNTYLEADLNQMYTSLYLSLAVTFFITGILALHYYSKEGIISTKKIFKWSVLTAALTAPVFTAVLFLYALSTTKDPNLYLWSNTAYGALLSLYVGMLLAVFVAFVVFIFVGFGMIGILSALEKGIAPEILLHVSRITPHLSDSAKKKDLMAYIGYSVLRWFFVIPDALDTKTLVISQVKPKKQFPWPILKKALMWQILLGIIVIIYISLNPFFLEVSSFQSLFSIAQNISIAIPFIILPWFVFLRLNARIKGPVKDFQLYSGVTNRMYRTFITLGTLIIIIRLALKNVNLRDVIIAFPIYYLFFIVVIFFITFVYFNYFENDLAKDVADRFDEIKDERLGQ
jgi:hypothetical protein